MRTGWRGDSFRHSLASKGIKTCGIENMNECQQILSDIEVWETRAEISWNALTPDQRFDAIMSSGFDPNHFDVTATYDDIVVYWLHNELPYIFKFENGLIKYYEQSQAIREDTMHSFGLRIVPIWEMKDYLNMVGYNSVCMTNNQIRREYKWIRKVQTSWEKKYYEDKMGWKK